MDSELQDRSSSFRFQLGYGVGHVLNDLCASLWFTYLLVFLHLVLEFSASQAGNLLLIGQVVDALSTPFVGYYSDHTENSFSLRYGKRKLWHLFGTGCVLISFPFVFSDCIECSSAHKWSQMYYFAAFITIFQIGWASVQISHLSLIPELSYDDHIRTHLTSIRYGFTVFSNLFVYLVTWAVLHVSGECDKQQVGPADAWKFRNIVFIVISVGTVASVLFHVLVKERSLSNNNHRPVLSIEGNVHWTFLKKFQLYQVAGVYMCTRLVVNVSQVLIPLYLHKTLGLPARSLAVVPLSMYLGSLFSAGLLRVVPGTLSRKLNYAVGCTFALSAFIWIYFGDGDLFKNYYIYIVAVFIGFGGAIMLVTGLALTADLVGNQTQASAFVYGLMSFTDKLSCGIAIAWIQMYADQSTSIYYRNALSIVCSVATCMGLIFTLLLPKLQNDMILLVNDADSDIVPQQEHHQDL